MFGAFDFRTASSKRHTARRLIARFDAWTGRRSQRDRGAPLADPCASGELSVAYAHDRALLAHFLQQLSESQSS
jgi:hypothetical protein